MAYSKKADKNLSAMGAGERESRKVATIYKKDGTSFKRKNANQYYPDGVPGGLEYTEKRPNRTDKGDWYKDGGNTNNWLNFKKEFARASDERALQMLEERYGEYINGEDFSGDYGNSGLKKKIHERFNALLEKGLIEQVGEWIDFTYKVKETKMKKGGKTKETSYNKKADKNLSAMGAGERESKKVATIYKKDGTSFKRKNANQYYPDGVPGGLEYTEKRPNRTDKGDWYKDGGMTDTFVYTIGGL